jgi:ATP-dependent exoDNAse (exonuclease V) beta subunit
MISLFDEVIGEARSPAAHRRRSQSSAWVGASAGTGKTKV